jgi:hypothetical protein
MGPYCGDGVQNGAEFCDNGINNGTYGFCNSGCNGFSEKCGDEILQREDCTGFTECVVLAGAAEACDDGEANGIYGYCDSSCSGMGPFCGDGIIHREDCTGYSNCIEIQGINEDCDSGEDNGKYGFCKLDCSGMNSTCGDGIKQSEEGEQCDDGANNGEYGYCQINCAGPGERCGDAVLQREDCTGFANCVEFEGAFEFCDSGADNGKYGFCASGCMEIGPYCGDGIKQIEEYCDDGENNGEYSYCNMKCNGLAERCGDGVLQESEGEFCDSGIANGNPGFCKTDCSGMVEYCGDGIKNGEEFCDSGADNGKYGFCASGCMEMGPYCGDGNIDGTFGETCDDAVNNGNTGFCNSTCDGMTGYCGDGITNGDEYCDDGDNNGQYNPFYGPYCSSDCMSMGEGGYCGDGIEQGLYEECDEGENNGPEGTCSYECTLNAYCGDGIIDEGEFCDTEDVQCSDFTQFSSGTAACPGDCSSPDFSTCVEDPAYISPFFTTSQTNCYDNAGIIACPSEGDPFYGQEPQFNYTIHDFTVETDTVLENNSGLMWQKETPSTYAGCTKGTPAGSECSLTEAVDYCANLELGGYDKWSLPQILEFNPVMNYAKSAPLIFDVFTASVSGNYLSGGIVGAMRVSLINGTVTQSTSFGKVKCVRSEFPYVDKTIFQSGDLFINILDPVVPKTVFWQYDSAQIEVDWEEALSYCSNVSEGGISGFRLPTVVELQSFAFESLYTVPPLVGSGTFWTSTTVHATPVSAYTVDFATGNVSMTGKTGTNFVICVK